MMNGDSKSDYTESAYSASSDSGSSEERRKSREHKHKKAKKSKSCKKKKKEKDKDNEPKKNTCPHCKKYHCRKSHCVEPDKCMWKKKYKGYRFKSICNELEVVSSHASNLRQTWVCMRRRKVCRANDSVRGRQRKERTRMINGLQ